MLPFNEIPSRPVDTSITTSDPFVSSYDDASRFISLSPRLSRPLTENFGLFRGFKLNLLILSSFSLNDFTTDDTDAAVRDASVARYVPLSI